MIENIKVTVTYEEKPDTKFDALVKELEAAKALAEATKATYEPLLECVGQAKLDCIYKQLETIVDHLKVISRYRGNTVVSVNAFAYDPLTNRHTVKVVYDPYCSGVPGVYLDGSTDSKDVWFDTYGIVTNWNKYDLYTKLEKQCVHLVEGSLEHLKRSTDNLVHTYNKMVHD